MCVCVCVCVYAFVYVSFLSATTFSVLSFILTVCYNNNWNVSRYICSMIFNKHALHDFREKFSPKVMLSLSSLLQLLLIVL